MNLARKTTMTATAVLLGAAVALTGCGDDDDGGGDVATYCNLNEEFNNVEGIPSDDQLDEIVSAAPSEIKDAAETLVDVLKEEGEDAFLDSEPPQDVIDAIDELNEFEQENCETDADGDAEADTETTDEG